MLFSRHGTFTAAGTFQVREADPGRADSRLAGSRRLGGRAHLAADHRVAVDMTCRTQTCPDFIFIQRRPS